MARVRRAHLHGVPRVLLLRAQGEVRDRVHGAPQQPGPLRPAGHARGSDVRPRDAGRDSQRAGDGEAVKLSRPSSLFALAAFTALLAFALAFSLLLPPFPVPSFAEVK